MLDKSRIGHAFPSFTAEVEKGRLKFFAKAIGETNPIYTDEVAAIRAGYRSLPAPPTFTSVLDQESPDFLPVLDLLGIDIAKVRVFCADLRGRHDTGGSLHNRHLRQKGRCPGVRRHGKQVHQPGWPAHHESHQHPGGAQQLDSQ